MKIVLTLPCDHIEAGDEFLSAQGIAEVAATAERLGFHAASCTDHPVPTGRWLDGGGHHAQDPFVILSYVASATTRLRLQTGILVLPYRNPFITARSVATLDVLSGGRVSLGVGAGYLKAEYKAVGADFDRRNEVMDEYLRAMKAAWTQDEFTFKGSGYEALGNRILPRPVQRPHPPLLIGGNAKRAIRRAAELGDSWVPFLTPGEGLSATARTAAMTDESDLARGVAYLRECCEVMGRETPPDVALSGLNSGAEGWSSEQVLDRIGRFAALGVGVGSVTIAGRDRAEWTDTAERFAAEVMSRLG